MIKKLLIFTLSLMLITLTGCKSAPVYNVDGATATTPLENPTAKDVRKAIVRAGTRLGWQMEDTAENSLTGTLNLRKHVAVITIDYTASSYSITYKDSENLQYNDGTIHSNYNGWVQNLEKEIKTELSLL